jgi:hypothetical protein
MSRLITLGQVSRETRAVALISKVYDQGQDPIFYNCVNNNNPQDAFTGVKPGTIKQAVDEEVYTCTPI